MPSLEASPSRPRARIVIRPAPRDKTRAILQFGPLRLQAALGRHGRTVLKREGDGRTPVAPMRLLDGYVRGDRLFPGQSGLRLQRLRAGMLWCDQSGHAAYNRPVRAPFTAGHENMMRDDRLYDVCLVLDWNMRERRRGRGSAIFFHLTRSEAYPPTAGCIAISPRDMKRLLPHLRRGMLVTVL